MNPIAVTPREDQSGTAMMREYVGIARRNKWLILGVRCFVSWYWHGVIAFIATEVLPIGSIDTCEEPKILENVVQNSGENKFRTAYLFLIQRQIMSLDFFGPIAKEFNLYPKNCQEKKRI